MEELLVYLAVHYKGHYRQIFEALQRKERPDPMTMRSTLDRLHMQWTTLVSDDYPACLKQIPHPPFVLFYYGNWELVKEPMLAMVGMRKPTDYGRRMAYAFAHDLSDRFVIVSGMAKGIDTCAHQGAGLDRTIAVLGCGIDYCYPACNRALYERLKVDGLIMSEYPLDLAPRKHYFPWRNRLVAGLGQALVVVQAKAKSGTMTTVSHALDQGKSVYALPCRIGDPEGTLQLIRDGAILLDDPKRLEEELTFEIQKIK